MRLTATRLTFLAVHSLPLSRKREGRAARGSRTPRRRGRARGDCELAIAGLLARVRLERLEPRPPLAVGKLTQEAIGLGPAAGLEEHLGVVPKDLGVGRLDAEGRGIGPISQVPLSLLAERFGQLDPGRGLVGPGGQGRGEVLPSEFRGAERA